MTGEISYEELYGVFEEDAVTAGDEFTLMEGWDENE